MCIYIWYMVQTLKCYKTLCVCMCVCVCVDVCVFVCV